jgi:hypothetical protein
MTIAQLTAEYNTLAQTLGKPPVKAFRTKPIAEARVAALKALVPAQPVLFRRTKPRGFKRAPFTVLSQLVTFSDVERRTVIAQELIPCLSARSQNFLNNYNRHASGKTTDMRFWRSIDYASTHSALQRTPDIGPTD